MGKQGGELEAIVVEPEYLSTIITASDDVKKRAPPISILGFFGMAISCCREEFSNVKKVKPDPSMRCLTSVGTKAKPPRHTKSVCHAG
ncbi:MAG TPA: hypothetical protein VLU47_01670, partial [Blastocatellia bacterium]|nr:hypothetical protein [Blastocatellia bacterium]